MVVDAEGVGWAAGEDRDALDVREGLEELRERLWGIALGVLEAVADDPGSGHVGYDDGVDEVHVWVIRLEGDQIFQRMEVGFPRSN